MLSDTEVYTYTISNMFDICLNTSSDYCRNQSRSSCNSSHLHSDFLSIIIFCHFSLNYHLNMYGIIMIFSFRIDDCWQHYLNNATYISLNSLLIATYRSVVIFYTKYSVLNWFTIHWLLFLLTLTAEIDNFLRLIIASSSICYTLNILWGYSISSLLPTYHTWLL